MSEGQLPFTGFGITAGGVFFDQLWLLIFGVMLVGIGAAMLRFKFRPGKNIETL